MSEPKLLDWTDAARLKVAATVDKDALEKAFMDQSYGFVANKASDLFRDPYRLGFEVVFKNDAMTRMVGLFAFRLGKRLLYAPVFFLNGVIKGHDLLYRHWIKKFCPNTPEWVSYLIENAENAIGSPVDRSEAGKIRSAVNFASIAGPPAYKAAAVQSEWASLLDELSGDQGLPGPVLADFLVKHAASGAFDRLAALIDASVPFAEAVAGLPEEVWCPQVPKTAAAPPAPSSGGCVTLAGLPPNATPEEASYFYRHGYLMRDKRAAEELSDTETVTDVATGIPGPGKYKVMTPGGEWREMLAAYDAGSNDLWSDPCCTPEPYYPDYRRRETHRPVVLVDTASGHSFVCREPQNMVVDESDAGSAFEDVSGVGSDKPKAGEVYRILDPGAGVFSRAFKVLATDTENGLTTVAVVYSNPKAKQPDQLLRINPDAPETSLSEGILNSSVRFVPVAIESGDSWLNLKNQNAIPGTLRDFDRWVMAHPGQAKKASLRHDYGQWRLEVDGRFHEDDRRGMHAKLASLGLGAATGAELLDAVVRGPRKFWIIKRAFPTRLVEQERFVDGHDPAFGLELETPQRALLRTDTQRVRNAVPMIGDAMDPSMGAGPGRRTSDPIPQDLVLHLPPEQLAQIARTQKLPQVFEHGVIGSMVKTYDSLAMIESYIPAFENCIDRLGRALFLFYFKPSDFEKAYGTDDMQTQENDFLNAFKVVGDLTLDLLKRRRAGGGGDMEMEQEAGTSVPMVE